MSDPSDPYRMTDIGGGVNPFGESIESLSGVEEAFSGISDKLEGLTKSFGPIAKKLEGFKPVAKEMNKSKFGKATKGLKNMFKSMLGAAASGDKIGMLMAALKPLLSVLEPLGNLIKPFTLILDLVSVLISAMVGAALVPMYEALQPIYDAIVDLIPTFVELGGIIGELIAGVLVFLIDIIILLLPPFIEFMKRLMESEGFMVLVAVALGILIGNFGPLIMIIIWISTLIIGLVTVFTLIANVVNDVVMPAIGTFIMGMAIMIDAITLGMAGAVNFVNKLLGSLPGDTPTSTTTYSSPSVGIGGVQMLGSGGVVSHGIYELGEEGEKEVVTPLTKWEKNISEQTALIGLMHDELVAQSYHNRKMIRMAEWNRVFG